MDDDITKQSSKQPTKVRLRLDVKDVAHKRVERSDVKQIEHGDDVAAQPDETPTGEGLTVLYEDNHVLVVIKPQNIPTQADSSGDTDLLKLLKRYLIEKYRKSGDAYVGMVHRLDRPTGGVMVFAKTSKAAGRLCEQIRDIDGEFEKTYLAVVYGRPSRTGKIEHFLAKDEKANIVAVVPPSIAGAKRAEATIKELDGKRGMTLVSVNLITGRSHQARVQLKALGSPIIGDVKYAGDRYVKSPHLALWAYKLVFNHPVTGEKLRFLALPPDEFPWNEFDGETLIDINKPQDTARYNI